MELGTEHFRFYCEQIEIMAKCVYLNSFQVKILTITPNDGLFAIIFWSQLKCQFHSEFRWFSHQYVRILTCFHNYSWILICMFFGLKNVSLTKLYVPWEEELSLILLWGKYIFYIYIYIWNRNRLKDINIKLIHTKWEKSGGRSKTRVLIKRYKLLYMK